VPTFRRLFPAAAIGLILTLGLVGCGGHPTVHRSLSIVPATASAGAAFSPDVITVSNKDNLVLSITNPTSATHGFTIEGYGIATEIPPGTTDVKVHAVHPGTFKIYCQLHPTHSTATLVVQ
jgi:nitrous oxide reductase